jgi:hypothetical protein
VYLGFLVAMAVFCIAVCARAIYKKLANQSESKPAVPVSHSAKEEPSSAEKAKPKWRKPEQKAERYRN